jgi:type I restriction enzyme M protein
MTKGRAGFVMANSASDARASEQDIRQKLIEAAPSMSWSPSARTCSTPSRCPARCGSSTKVKRRSPRADTVLFIDARHIYRQIDRAHRDWTPAQISFIANLVRLYRGEALDFTLGGDEAKSQARRSSSAQKSTPKPRPHRNRPLSLPRHPRPLPRRHPRRIEAQGWSLNPGRYVGVAPGEAVSDEDFKTQLETLNEELETLNAQARELEANHRPQRGGDLEA